MQLTNNVYPRADSLELQSDASLSGLQIRGGRPVRSGISPQRSPPLPQTGRHIEGIIIENQDLLEDGCLLRPPEEARARGQVRSIRYVCTDLVLYLKADNPEALELSDKIRKKQRSSTTE